MCINVFDLSSFLRSAHCRVPVKNFFFFMTDNCNLFYLLYPVLGEFYFTLKCSDNIFVVTVTVILTDIAGRCYSMPYVHRQVLRRLAHDRRAILRISIYLLTGELLTQKAQVHVPKFVLCYYNQVVNIEKAIAITTADATCSEKPMQLAVNSNVVNFNEQQAYTLNISFHSTFF